MRIGAQHALIERAGGGVVVLHEFQLGQAEGHILGKLRVTLFKQVAQLGAGPLRLAGRLIGARQLIARQVAVAVLGMLLEQVFKAADGNGQIGVGIAIHFSAADTQVSSAPGRLGACGRVAGRIGQRVIVADGDINVRRQAGRTFHPHQTRPGGQKPVAAAGCLELGALAQRAHAVVRQAAAGAQAQAEHQVECARFHGVSTALRVKSIWRSCRRARARRASPR